MQHDHSGGVLAGLIFSTLFLVAIGSLSWAPRMRIVNGALVAASPAAPTASAASGAAAGYELASKSSVPVKLTPRRSFARGGAAGSEARRRLWRSQPIFVARRLARPRT